MKPWYERYPRTARTLRVTLRPFFDYDLSPRMFLLRWVAFGAGIKYLFGL